MKKQPSTLMEAMVAGASNWSRGPDIRILTEKGVEAYAKDPAFKKEMEDYAVSNSKEEGVATEIRALHTEGTLLYRAEPPKGCVACGHDHKFSEPCK